MVLVLQYPLPELSESQKIFQQWLHRCKKIPDSFSVRNTSDKNTKNRPYKEFCDDTHAKTRLEA